MVTKNTMRMMVRLINGETRIITYNDIDMRRVDREAILEIVQFLDTRVDNFDWLFQGLTNLTKVCKIPDCVRSMNCTFAYCSNLNQDIDLSELKNLTTMNGCFKGCSSFNGTVTLPDSVVEAESAFEDCVEYDKPITFHTKIRNIIHCFKNCESLNSVITIQYDNEPKYDYGAFDGCYSLDTKNVVRL